MGGHGLPINIPCYILTEWHKAGIFIHSAAGSGGRREEGMPCFYSPYLLSPTQPGRDPRICLTMGLPVSPVLKTSPSNVEDMSSIPGQSTKIPHGKNEKHKSNIVTKSMKTFKNVHIKNSLKKKRRELILGLWVLPT